MKQKTDQTRLKKATSCFIWIGCLLFSLSWPALLRAQTPDKQDATRTDVHATEAIPSRENTSGWRFSYEAGQTSFDPQIARAYGISENGLTFIRMSGGVFFLKYLYIDAGFGILHLKDNDRFTQTVIGGFGGNIPRDARSSITAGDGYIGLGAGTRVAKHIRVEGMLGSAGFSATRSISFCVDCFAQDLPLKGGYFLRYRLVVGEKTGFHVSYRQYLGDSDAQKTLFIGFLYTGK